MTTVASHEVLGDDKFPVLILLHLEHWHVVKDGVDEARRANEVAEPGDRDPKVRIDEVLLN